MMRRYILYDLLAAIVAGLCLCGLFTACGEDRGGDLPDDDPNSCLVTITLRASLPIRPPQTKAGEAISWENDDEYERDITDWLVVAYDESGVLAGYTSSEGTYNKNDDNSRTSVDMRLPVGTYRFYAFANLASLEGGEALLEQIKNTNSNPGDLGLSEEALTRAVNILASGNSIDGRNGTLGGKFGGTDTEGTGNRLRIPMSSYAQEHTLAPAPAPNTFKIPLIRMIGKMKYRSSYGQNLLQHARETANLAGIMAAELGLNPKTARRAGLLHDIGKVPDDEPELPHAIIGMKLAEKYKEKPEVCNAIGAHHDEIEMSSLIAPIIQVCDAISGARPGARREVVESYIKRLKEMEDIALSYPGVVKTYTIQAGRELRVIVGAEKLSDMESESLSHDIAKKIQDEMTYPGQVKITVIRETRSVAYAK